MKKVLLLILVFIVNGCYMFKGGILDPNYVNPQQKKEQIKQTLKGKHYSVVIQKLGAYTREAEDGLGGKIYIWEKKTEESTTREVNPFYGNNYIPGLGDDLFYEKHHSAKTEQLQIFCDEDGIIYNVIY